MVRAKFKLTSITEHAHTTARTLKFAAEYDPTIPEDLRFQKATPWGQFEMTIDNPSALGQFAIGASYYLDISPTAAPAD